MTEPTGTGSDVADPAAPVTASFTRRADPRHAIEMTAWIGSGFRLAERFPGFLGGGWVRSRDGSDEWHMLCRFDTADALQAWEGSGERAWWLASAQGLAEVTRAERRTGIEGWFDEPASVRVAPSDRPSAPPRWKQAVLIWTAFFPLNLLATVTVGQLVEDWPVAARVLVLTLCLTPVMVYLALPFMTRRLEWWLQGRRFRDR